MQQTSIDRWLRRQFVYICKIYCNSLPEEVIPKGVRVDDAGDGNPGRFRYCLTVSNDRQLRQLASALEFAGITYTSRVTERGGAVGRLFNHPDKSFTLQIVWIAFTAIIIAFALSGLPVRLWIYLSAEDPESREPRPPAAAGAADFFIP
jgi:hypothetical protein